MKEFFVFFKTCSVLSQLRIIKSFFDLPALLFHELTHIIIALILWVEIKQIQTVSFYKIKDNSIVTEFRVITSVPDNFFGHLRHFFISISPIIGMCILIWFFPNYFVSFYMGFSFQSFFMSDVDIDNAGRNLQKIHHSISKLLQKIIDF